MLALPYLAEAQPFLITEQNATTCQGAFLDSGGQGATGYGNDEDETYVLCPGTPGSLISVAFVTGQLSTGGAAPVDNLTIYDGNSIIAPLIGTYSGGALQGQTVSASETNASGCLTFVWHSNEAGTGVFAGTIHCRVPCVAPVAAAVMSEAAPARVCVGEAVSFNGASSTVQPGFNISTWAWDFNDGTSATSGTPNTTHAFSDAGVYRVQLTVTDNNGCASENRLDLQVHVGTTPNFDGTTAPPPGCLGEPLCLTGEVHPTPFLDEPATTYGDGVFIPDDVGSCFEAELYLTQFTAGATLMSIGQLLGLCMNFEHTWLGDLVITITSPSGQSVILHQQNITSEVWMGDAIDNDENNPQPGTCAPYCFANTAANGTMADAANSGGGGGPSTLPPGTYESLYPLTGLIGSQLNGLWTLTICDLWALDNGFLCDWSLEFDPALYTNIIGYTPQFGAGCDSTWWTGPSITSTEANCDAICVTPASAGTFPYVYHAIDDLGCAFDTTVQVTVVPAPVADAGLAATNCAGQGVQLNGAVVSGGLPQVAFIYTWQASAGSTPAPVAAPLVDPQATTTYTLTIGQIGHPLCQGSDQVVVDVVEPPWPGVGAAITLCENADALMLMDQLTQDPASGGSWSAPDGSPHTGTFDPQIDGAGIYTYEVPSQAPCPSSAQSEVLINVTNAAFAGLDGSTTLCSDGEASPLFAFLGDAADASGSWHDALGAAFSGTYQPGQAQIGPFAYVSAGTSPCPNDTAFVTVVERMAVHAGVDAGVQHCSNLGDLELFPLLNGDPDGGGIWREPDGTTFNGIFDPASDPEGTYLYVMQAMEPCLNDSASISISTSSPSVFAEILQPATCSGWCDGAAQRTLVGGVEPMQTLWSNTIAGVNDTLADDLCAGAYSVLVVDEWGCRDSAQFVITEPPPLVVDLIFVTDERCVGSCDGSVEIGDAEAVEFSFDGGATWGLLDHLPEACPDTIALAIRNASGCEAEGTAMIGSPRPITADFTVDRSIVDVTESMVHFFDLSEGASVYAWDFGGLGTSDEGSPGYTFPGVFGAEYLVCLHVANEANCTDSICHPIIVQDVPQLHVPNAFSPNGDGINDQFVPIIDLPQLIGNYELLIFDRWGELIYDTDRTGASWDGKYNEDLVPPDVYVWKLRGKDEVTGDPFERIGHVTVVR